MNTGTVSHSNGMGLAAMICGIVGLAISIIPVLGFAAWALAPIAIILGIVGMRRANAPKGGAITGMITGVLALLICFAWASAFNDAVEKTDRDMRNTSAEFDRAMKDARLVAPAPASPTAAPQSVDQIPAQPQAANGNGFGNIPVQQGGSPAGSMTLTKFEQIQKGMTYEQVVAIVGSPGKVSSDIDLGGTSMRSYEWDGNGGISTANLSFQNGVLQSKMQMGLE